MSNQNLVEKFSETPVLFSYPPLSNGFVEGLIKDRELIVLSETGDLILDQTYYKAGYSGCSSLTYTRKAVAFRLEYALQILRPEFGLFVFDAYRSIAAQRALFETMMKTVSERNSNWNHEQIFQEACKYMVHPDDKGRFPIAPHNSGGAIDLALCKKGRLLEFGSSFDDPSIISSTRFFESEYDSQSGFSKEEWMIFRRHRRILFHTLVSLGFTNYQDEWWHFDLGDCMWAKEFDQDWYFDSLEADVVRYARNL